ncbi:MAG TPA: MEDS domain-containing protein [Solirubrobacteraceae bacterium]|nr:MEDS domain-containing protein [Solirubrobacteraceae bacterium]
MRRRASIEDGADLRPHDHVVWFGDGPGDLYSLASAALAEGARRHEKLMFVAEDPDPARLTGVEGLDRLLADGQLELLDVDAVYGDRNGFSAAGQLATFEGVLAEALGGGYRGIRVVADNTPLVQGDEESFRRWLAWEQLTDRFQASSMVTGVCFFDRAALSGERQVDLATLHPVRRASIAEPSFSLFSDGDAAVVAGALDGGDQDQWRRMLGTLPLDRPLVLDLAAVAVADERALLALGEWATADRPLHIRGIGHLRELVSQIEAATPHVRFQYGNSGAATCAHCGQPIGIYEPAVVVEHPPARYHRACYGLSSDR